MTPAAHLSYPADAVAPVTIDNPPRNFGSAELAGKILTCVNAAVERECAAVVLASDVPGYFIAHWSLQYLVDTFSCPPGGAIRSSPANLFDALETLPIISIAANNGQAWGGGSGLSWACDLRIAAESATYGQPEVALGIIPGGGGTTRLARLIGFTKCMEMILDCRPIGAREALAIGAINKVVPDERLREEAIAWAAHIARWPRRALAAAKRSLVEGHDLPLSAARRNERQIFADIARRPEALDVMRRAQAGTTRGRIPSRLSACGVHPGRRRPCTT